MQADDLPAAGERTVEWWRQGDNDGTDRLISVAGGVMRVALGEIMVAV
jgi:hypothetical protein